MSAPTRLKVRARSEVQRGGGGVLPDIRRTSLDSVRVSISAAVRRAWPLLFDGEVGPLRPTSVTASRDGDRSIVDWRPWPRLSEPPACIIPCPPGIASHCAPPVAPDGPLQRIVQATGGDPPTDRALAYHAYSFCFVALSGPWRPSTRRTWEARKNKSKPTVPPYKVASLIKACISYSSPGLPLTYFSHYPSTLSLFLPLPLARVHPGRETAVAHRTGDIFPGSSSVPLSTVSRHDRHSSMNSFCLLAK